MAPNTNQDNIGLFELVEMSYPTVSNRGLGAPERCAETSLLLFLAGVKQLRIDTPFTHVGLHGIDQAR